LAATLVATLLYVKPDTKHGTDSSMLEDSDTLRGKNVFVRHFERCVGVQPEGLEPSTF
jgi:hypothetical protein